MLVEILSSELGGLRRVYVIDHVSMSGDKMHLIAFQDIKQLRHAADRCLIGVTHDRAEYLSVGREDQRSGLIHITQIILQPFKLLRGEGLDIIPVASNVF